MKLFLLMLFFCVSLLLASIVYFSKQDIDFNAAYCGKVTNIAKNGEKMSYVRKWITEKLKDEKFLEATAMKGKIELRYYPQLIALIDLNWDFLGLDKNLAFISINRNFSDLKAYTDLRTIKSITFGQGRFSIIVKLSESDDFGLEWASDEINKLKRVGDNIYVDCHS